MFKNFQLILCRYCLQKIYLLKIKVNLHVSIRKKYFILYSLKQILHTSTYITGYSKFYLPQHHTFSRVPCWMSRPISVAWLSTILVGDEQL